MIYYYIKKIKIDKDIAVKVGVPKKRGCLDVHNSNPSDDLKNKSQTDS